MPRLARVQIPTRARHRAEARSSYSTNSLCARWFNVQEIPRVHAQNCFFAIKIMKKSEIIRLKQVLGDSARLAMQAPMCGASPY
eukprot:1588901-Pleurochrysis_carterae.AAC.1